MRWILYLAALIGVCVLPAQKVDVGKLCPVEVVAMSLVGDAVVLKTDTGNMGIGKTVDQAAENLRATTAGMLYLDTAKYLLVDENAWEWVPGVRKYLKQTVQIYEEQGVTDLQEAARFLDVHTREDGTVIVQGTSGGFAKK